MAGHRAREEVANVQLAIVIFGVATIPDLDLCVMNPPFVRSVGGNLLFGSLPDDERKALQTELKKQAKSLDAEITAGLGSAFVALADRHMKPGGRLAFILPVALASGEAWAPTRRLIAARYHLETVITSHDAERPNFSENTDLGEVMFIARRLAETERPGRTTYVNLWRNPTSIHEALDLAARVEAVATPARIEDSGFTSIKGEGRKLGEVFTTPAPTGEGNWTGALFAQTELMRIGQRLFAGKGLPFSRLDELGGLGYDRRDIHDAFTVSNEDWSPYDAFWNHKADSVRTLAQQPNAKLVARTTAAPGRHLKSATAVWAKAGKILLAERSWPPTQSLLAVSLGSEALGNTWWSLNTASLSDDQVKVLAAYLNSSIGFFAFYARRVVTRSAWMQLKKPAWQSMPVLDVRALDPSQLESLAKAYDAVANEPLLPLAKLNIDPIRRKIDDALAVALGLPDLKPLRDLLAREPGLTGAPIGRPAAQGALALNEPSAPDGGLDL